MPQRLIIIINFLQHSVKITLWLFTACSGPFGLPFFDFFMFFGSHCSSNSKFIQSVTQCAATPNNSIKVNRNAEFNSEIQKWKVPKKLIFNASEVIGEIAL